MKDSLQINHQSDFYEVSPSTESVPTNVKQSVIIPNNSLQNFHFVVFADATLYYNQPYRMKSIFVYLTAIITAVICSNTKNTVKVEDAIEKARDLVRNFLNGTANGLAPGLVIGVTVKGERKWLEGFGLANIENNVTMTGDAVMQIGSIGKSFTLGLASRLMYEGKLDFDAPIRDHLSYDEFPDRTWNGSVVNITLRQLFQMTAGIPNGPNESEVGTCLRCTNQTGRLAFVRDKKQDFEPGMNFTYSNFGIELAGVVIEKILRNKTFDVAFMEMVKNVLKLNETAIVNTATITPNLASFYTTNMRKVYNSGMWGDIFLNDFHAAGDAYHGRSEHFVKQSTVQDAWVPTEVSKNYLPYGLAWIIHNVTGDRPIGNRVVWHSGGTLGCRSMLTIYPETEIIVAASVNLAESPIDAFLLEGSIADLFFNATKAVNV
ncbi:Serine beta-lactamase-like protein LACTB, mitochondrial [Pseudolycoriella hygida]|uniref:Serine beta-lactamase-like protein LACTB, mitochondrial n=1 Tax=Pseudolycoriella hygida TaxID=35572 RepID=A0A9Q0N5S2_9DIPT|nr:Serine beta-lactamase-like protein LACTB, mitochondrial [Pseudolycoriella hygida]